MYMLSLKSINNHAFFYSDIFYLLIFSLPEATDTLPYSDTAAYNAANYRRI